MTPPLLAPAEQDIMTRSGGHYRYEYDSLSLLQAKTAEAVFHFHVEVADKRPARSFIEYTALNQHLPVIQAASYILRLVGPAGEMQPHRGAETAATIEADLLANLPVSDYPKLERVVTDFFHHSGNGAIAWHVLSRSDVSAMALMARVREASSVLMTGGQTSGDDMPKNSVASTLSHTLEHTSE